jgi:cell wall-associated NlpC family hydrolase
VTTWARHLRHAARRGAVVVGVLAVLATTLAPPARADSVSDKQAQARRLAAQIDAQGTRLETLAEKYDGAVLDEAKVTTQLAAAQAALDATNARAGGARTQLQAQAVTEYVNGMSMADLAAQAAGGDPLLKAQYARTLASTETDALDAMRAMALELKERQAALSAAQKAAATSIAAVKQNQLDAAKAESDLQSTLGQVKGDLVQLVADQQAAQAKADAARSAARLAALVAPHPAANVVSRGSPRAAAPRAPTVINAPPNQGAASAVAAAIAQIGKPYVWGAGGPDAVDCSGLTSYAWRYGGVSLPHNSAAQFASTRHVSPSQAQPGDLFFYGSPIHHVGIYVGNGSIVDAPHAGANVRYGGAYRPDLVGVGRP